MKTRTWRAHLFQALLCMSAVTAGAAEPSFYLTASLGAGKEKPESNGANFGNSLGIVHVDPDRVDIDDGALAWSAGIGYRVNGWLSAELEYVDFGKTDVAEHYTVDNFGFPFLGPSTLALSYSSKVAGPSLSALGTLPVGRHFAVFLRGGALFAAREYEPEFGRDEKFSRTVWLAGGGASWHFAKRWTLRAEYQRTGALSRSLISGETRAERASLGATFDF
ncbi:MAG TPA: outer membrane beta-barrel protein [Steroidobacteraceae bacterium]|nr:outer membrane beta-barrel protein [Steroidobacteraceae bacterium]